MLWTHPDSKDNTSDETKAVLGLKLERPQLHDKNVMPFDDCAIRPDSREPLIA